MVLRRNFYRGVYHQRGSGIGAVLSGLFRLLTPWIKRGAQAAIKSRPLKSALRAASKSALSTAATAASDIIAGKSPKANAKLNLQRAQKNITKAVTSALAERPSSSATKRPAKKRKHPQNMLSAKVKKPLI